MISTPTDLTTASTTWTRRHILSLDTFTPTEYNTILHTASSFGEVLLRRMKKVPALQGVVVTNMFFESSTRTRSSFELAAKRLSADILNFSPGTSSLTKGETILDTAKTYLAMGTNLMVIRHRQAGVPLAIAQEMDRLNTNVSILNAGDGQHAHPSQALLDLFTLCTQLNPDQPQIEDLADKKIAIVGDILHSRVARSNIWSLTASGADVHLAAPPTLLPPTFAEFCTPIPRGNAGKATTGSHPGDHPPSVPLQAKIQTLKSKIQNPRHLTLHHTLEPALDGADFVMTLRLQQERMTQHLLPSLREYHQQFGITRDRLQRCKPGVKVLHPGPTNRGVEISSDLMDDPDISLISRQVTSGVAVRMALLYLMGAGHS
ncbi:MAG: aspartate carbamoyltransferase catalytic subunit [Cyanothece sp. SIO2G6]|nr:aspartate carbamoyltransferase catalytic subunit [Cyanothece sp. SIO2G6]